MRRYPSTAIFLALALSAAAATAAAQQEERSARSSRIEIRLEKRSGSAWKPVDPGTVFEPGERLRFVFRANFDGYLYVMNQGTSGKYELLFPREDTGVSNRVEKGRDYIVPATAGGSFRVSGPEGRDVLYWMVTPIEVGKPAGERPGYVPLPPPPKPGESLGTLMPRCDDAIWKSRGECIDSQAGPRAIGDESPLPSNLRSVPRATSRELFFIRKEQAAVVSSPKPLAGPVVYEFHLAHR